MVATAYPWRAAIYSLLSAVILPCMAIDAAHGQIADSDDSDLATFDLADHNDAADVAAPYRVPQPQIEAPDIGTLRDSDRLILRITHPTGEPLDGDTRARFMAGTTRPGVVDYGEAAISEFDLRVGHGPGPSLVGSLGVTSQPRQFSDESAVLRFGSTGREDRATARIGLRF